MAYARFGLKDGWWGSTITTSSVAVASNTRERAMIFSVREKASSGATRRTPPGAPAGRAEEGGCIRSVGDGRAATNVPCPAASRLHLCEPGSGKDARSGESAISAGPPGEPAPARVDIARSRPYRPRSMDAEAVTSPDRAVSLTPAAVATVRELRAKEGRPETDVLRVSVVGG